MAYRRRQQGTISRHSAILVDEDDGDDEEEEEEEEAKRGIEKPRSVRPSSSLAAKAIRASSAYRDSSLSSAYGHSAHSSSISSRTSDPPTGSSSPSVSLQDTKAYEYTSMNSLNESKHGFWGALARKAKAILDDDTAPQQIQTPERATLDMHGTPTMGKYQNPNHSDVNRTKVESPTVKKGLGAITSSLNYIGGTIGNALEEGLTVVESRTADIIQETRKHIRKKPSDSEVQSRAPNHSVTRQQTQVQPQMQTDQELQLKASRDVRLRWPWLQKQNFFFGS